MEKIKNIELLGFLLILAVVGCHLKGIFTMFDSEISIYQILLKNVAWSWLSVDCFFIISGFFLFLKTDFTQKFFDFAKKKFIRFMPLILFMLGLYFTFSLFTPISFARYENIFVLLNLQNVGLTFTNSNVPASWFV